MTRPRTTFIVSPMTAKGETTDGIGASVLLNHVDKSFGATPAIDDLSLAIKPSEFMTLLGPSGSGKTTTLMMIAGFEIPTGGEIYIDSRPILGVPPPPQHWNGIPKLCLVSAHDGGGEHRLPA